MKAEGHVSLVTISQAQRNALADPASWKYLKSSTPARYKATFAPSGEQHLTDLDCKAQTQSCTNG